MILFVRNVPRRKTIDRSHFGSRSIEAQFKGVLLEAEIPASTHVEANRTTAGRDGMASWEALIARFWYVDLAGSDASTDASVAEDPRALRLGRGGSHISRDRWGNVHGTDYASHDPRDLH